MRCKNTRHVDRRRSVNRANDTDRGRFLLREAQNQRQNQRQEDPELTRSTQQHKLRVLQERSKVGQRTDPDEDQQREHFVAHAHLVQNLQHPVFGNQRRQRQVGEQTARANRQQQQRFVVLDDRKIEQDKRHADHDQRLPCDAIDAFHEQADRFLIDHLSPP